MFALESILSLLVFLVTTVTTIIAITDYRRVVCFCTLSAVGLALVVRPQPDVPGMWTDTARQKMPTSQRARLLNLKFDG